MKVSEREYEVLREMQKDAERLNKLLFWMASNVDEGRREIANITAICAWESIADAKKYLDGLPKCNVGLCEKRKD